MAYYYGGYLRDLLFYGSLCVMMASVRALRIGAIPSKRRSAHQGRIPAGCSWPASVEVFLCGPDGLPGLGELLADPDWGALLVVVDAGVVIQVCGETG